MMVTMGNHPDATFNMNFEFLSILLHQPETTMEMCQYFFSCCILYMASNCYYISNRSYILEGNRVSNKLPKKILCEKRPVVLLEV